MMDVAPVRALPVMKGGSALGSASCVTLLVITYLADHVKAKPTLQFINDMPNVIQKLLRCFGDTANLTSLVLP